MNRRAANGTIESLTHSGNKTEPARFSSLASASVNLTGIDQIGVDADIREQNKRSLDCNVSIDKTRHEARRVSRLVEYQVAGIARGHQASWLEVHRGESRST